MAKLSPSVLSSDYLTLKNQIDILSSVGVKMLHLDVMDGIFVPNISFGVPVISSIRKHTDMELDVHLMIDRPHRYIEDFAAVSDWLGFHYEAGSDSLQLLKKIRELGCKSYITIKPKTPAEAVFELLPFCDMVLVMSVEPGFGGQKFMPSALEKLRILKEHCRQKGYSCELEVDGGIDAETAALAVSAGATVLVAGSYIFSAEDPAAAAKSLILLGEN